MKPAVVVGTRPEIIKMAPVVRALRARQAPPLLVHTGQHYSFEMDGVFFAELGLAAADVNLEVGSGTQAYQIASVMSGFESFAAERRPDIVLVEGDTNSVLAAALAANKSGIPVGHVEAGLRSYDRSMPEEINRILTDHLAEHLFAPTPRARDILRGEGIAAERIEVTGNTVVDELRLQRGRARSATTLERFGVRPRGYALATFHRAENVDRPARLRGILAGLAVASAALGHPVLAALHPRTQARIADLGEAPGAGIRVLPPLGYLDFLALHAGAALMLTDSGGLQEEACCLGVPCVTLRDNTERPESVEVGANVLAGTDPARIEAAAREMAGRRGGWPNPFGDGHAGERIADRVLRG
ncbi:MAG TPA: UDP-N-acetylglucosamine 2-epimerase (non-hydrolyzing) [Terriglobales bacterium]|nr:UDP-N-acetylglucosamine 2-epimerase (non-hydrolyzing) [Terriglobales bacterium]